ncbi:hypothetical protein CYMTET_45911 [Cymbomonas tetramitiformis]|uniref:IPT/TIG domain-containing protein n=1 Tax=Cymbomonas tetramitiformis TaxID=36881 RepID=A0AAE0BYE8_9CHLO|nr:hypothetical protein CYMTET_45911 [Cymbomonas tetramitiformis]
MRGSQRMTPVLALCLLFLAGSSLAAPTLTTSTSTLTYTEQTSAINVDDTIALESDEFLNGATIQIVYPGDVLDTSGAQIDELSISGLGNGISSSGFNPSTKTISLSGSASSTAYQKALRTLTFYNPSDALSADQRTVTYTVTDINGASVTADRYVNIFLIDNPPTVTFSHTSISYTESQGELFIDSNVQILDDDSTETASVQVQITGGYESGQDVLSFGDDVDNKADPNGDNLGVRATWDSSTGTLRAAGAVLPLGTYQEILRTVKFVNPSQTISTATRTFTYTVADATGADSTSPLPSLDMTVSSVNQAPVISMSTSQLSVSESDPSMNVASDFSITDIDDSNMAGATVSISGAFEAGKDVLGCSSASMSCSYDTQTGVLTLSGSASISAYTTAMQGVQYSSVGGAANTGTRTLTFGVTDGKTASNQVSRNIAFTSSNDAPVLTGTTSDGTYQELGPLTIQPLLAITDSDTSSMASATVSIISGFDPNTDFLTVTVSGAIQSSFDSAAGVLSLTGTESIQRYQDVLRTVQLGHSAYSSSNERVISFTVNDGDPNGAQSSAALSRTCWAVSFMTTPTITSTTTTSTAGGTITVIGTGFGPIAPSIVTNLYLGGVPLKDVAVIEDDVKLTATVEAGTGAGLVMQIVVNDINSPSYEIFAYTAPTVSNTTTPVSAGEEITVTGGNFGPVGNSYVSSVYIGGYICEGPTVTVAHTTITCTMPPGAGMSKDVVVTIAGQPSGSSGNGLFRYQAPEIATVTKGSFLGYSITITGKNFGPAGTEYANVTFQNLVGGNVFKCLSTVVTIQHIQLTCTVPAMSLATGANTADVTLNYTAIMYAGNQGSGTSGVGKFSYEAPVITNVTTISMWGDMVTITGRNFGPVNTSAILEIGNLTAPGTFVSSYSCSYATMPVSTTDVDYSGITRPQTTVEDTTITLYVPDYVTGGGGLSPDLVLTISGLSSTAFTATSMFEGPVIINETSGSQFGSTASVETITIRGRNFGPKYGFDNTTHKYKTGVTMNASYAQVNIDNLTASSTNYIVVASPTYMTFTQTPASSTSPYTTQDADITVYMLCSGTTIDTCASSGTTGNDKFDYSGPTISGSSQVTTAGGSVNINGANFGGTGDTYITSVTICANAACSLTHACSSPTVTSNSRITCTLAASGSSAYAVKSDIVVVMNGLTGTGTRAFSWAAPTLTNVTTVAAAGGTMTLIGTNLGAYPGAVAITATGTSSTYTCTDIAFTTADTTITCTMSAGMGTGLTITLTLSSDTGYSKSVTLASALSYDAPVVTSASSTSTSGGTVTIIGYNFGTDASLISAIVNGQTLTSLNLTVSDTTLVGTYGQAGTGANLAVIVTADTQSSATANVFNYSSPTITSVVSPAPAIYGSSTITIEGTNFGPTTTTALTINATGTPSAVIDSCTVTTADTRIECTTNPGGGCIDSTVTSYYVGCGTSARDLTVNVNGLSVTKSSALTFGPPTISSIYGSSTGSGSSNQISFHMSTYDVMQIVGYNFGSAAATEGSTMYFASICPKTHIDNCTWPADYSNATAVTKSSSTLLTATFDALTCGYSCVNKNYSVLVGIGDQTSGTSGSAVVQTFLGPTLSSYTPTTGTGTAGGTITVSGLRFGPTGTARIGTLTWNYDVNAVGTATSYAASAVSATVSTKNTAMTFVVPEGTGSKPFRWSFSNLADTVLSTGTLTFTYDAPTVSAVSAPPVSGGTIYINGTNFGPLGSTVNNVTVNGTECTSPAVTVAHTQISCIVAAGTGVDLNLTLYVDGQVSSQAVNGTSFVSYSGPTITSVENITTNYQVAASTVHQAAGYNYTAGWVKITGSNFGFLGDAVTTVYVGAILCSFPYVTVYNTEIQCQLGTSYTEGYTAGSGSGTNYNVNLTLSTGLTTSMDSAFTYLNPTVTAVTAVSYFGGDVVTLTGTNFGCSEFGKHVVPYTCTQCVLPASYTSTRAVTVNSKDATNVTLSVIHTEVTFLAPAMLDLLNILNLPLTITVDGLSASTTFSYIGPSITACSEASLFGGLITVTGVNFGPVGGSNVEIIYIGGIVVPLAEALPNVTVANTELQFTAPAGIGQQLNVLLQIRTQDTGTSGNGLLNYRGPRVTGSIGSLTEGGTGTVLGANFGPVGSANINEVKINGADCLNPTVTVENTEIECTVVAGTGGPYDIDLRIADITDSGTGIDMYNYSNPVITDVAPMDQEPGSVITITGSSFGADISKVSITVGAVACKSISMFTNHTQLLCETPDTSGAGFAVVVTVDGLVSDAGSYSTSPPIVTAVSSVGMSGGTVTITGNFFGATGKAYIDWVTLGTSLCRSPQVTTKNTRIMCTASEGLTQNNGGSYSTSDLDGDGYMDVRVSISSQTSGLTGAGLFRFEDATITSFTKVSNLYYGDEVLVTGTNLNSVETAVAITVGDYSAASVTVETNQIRINFAMPVGTGENNEFRMFINNREVLYTELQGSRFFSYSPPIIYPSLTVNLPGTDGGLAYFGGQGFGPIGTSRIQSAEIYDLGMPCRDPNVTQIDRQFSCTVISGTGLNHDVRVTVDGQDSGDSGKDAMSYAAPVIDFVNPNSVRAGGYLYLFGANFGIDRQLISVALMAEALGAAATQPAWQGFACDDVQLIEFHQQIRCTVGVGVGTNIRVRVAVDGLNNTMDENDNLLTYPAPYLYSVTESTTAGGADNGPVTIFGANFGPVGEVYKPLFDSVQLGTSACKDPAVTVADTQIECLPPAGSGFNLDVLVSIGNLDSGTSGNALFSYQTPLIESSTPIPTEGGLVSIIGKNFGEGSTNANLVVKIYDGERCSAGVFGNGFYGDVDGCTPTEGLGEPEGARVIDHNLITFTIGPGTGKDYDLYMERDGLSSETSGNDKFRYELPVVEAVDPRAQPADVTTELTITVTGYNFGTDTSLCSVTIGGRLCDQETLRLYNFPSDTKSEITVKPPYGAGDNLPVVVIVNNQSSLANMEEGTYSYFVPVVESVLPVSTAGGLTTIRGQNFGPEGEIFEVRIADEPCTDAEVSVDGVEITCFVVPGTGTEKDVFVKITNDTNMNSQDSGIGKFSYQAPVIESVDPIQARAGTFVTIIGRNFGTEVSKILLQLGYPSSVGGTEAGTWSSDEYQMLRAHERFLARLPVGYGEDLEVITSVDGQRNVIEGSDKTYTFKYLAPQVMEASVVPTQGGVLTVSGQDFGPIGVAGALDYVYVRYWKDLRTGDPVELDARTGEPLDNNVLPCTDPVVTVDNVEVMCNLSQGVGQSLDVQVSSGGQESEWETVFRYGQPEVHSINPPQAGTGETVNVTGINFGASIDQVELLLDGLPVPAADVSIGVPHTQLQFKVPMGTGTQLSIVVRTPVQQSVAGLMVHTQESIPVKVEGGGSTVFSYNYPVVSQITPSETTGGEVTITGENFGSAGKENLEYVNLYVGGITEPCLNATVSQADTEITCTMPAGAGGGYSVVVRIDSLTNQGGALYSYLGPVVESIRPQKAFPGTMVTIAGRSFGTDPARVSVMIGSEECTNVRILLEHAQIRCDVGESQGSNQSIVMTVSGVSGLAQSSARFTYEKAGCMDPDAENYDAFVTSDDGSCRILGCTSDPDSKANVDDGTCVRDPEVVTLEMKLDYDNEYLPDAEEYNKLIKQDVASQLTDETGQTIIPSRIIVDDVYAGSTVFKLLITDEPDSRAEDLLIALENRVLSNHWNMDVFTLLEMEWENSQRGTVATKESEPRVSQASVIGVCLGIGVVLLWAIFWRKLFLRIAKSCCSSAQDDELDQQALMEVQIMQNQSFQNGNSPSGYKKLDKSGAGEPLAIGV